MWSNRLRYPIVNRLLLCGGLTIIIKNESPVYRIGGRFCFSSRVVYHHSFYDEAL